MRWSCGVAAAVLTVLAGACGSGSTPPGDHASAAPAGHEHHAPHGGTLVELGDEFAHVEMVFDPPAGRLTAFVLDGEAEHPIRLPDHVIGMIVEGIPEFANKPLDLIPVPDVLTGETVGNTSQFALTLPAFTRMTAVTGRILSLTVRGRGFQDLRFEVRPAAGEARVARKTSSNDR